MPLFIKNITAKNIGPIPKFQEEFGKLNILYGKNETGKTYLAELFARCLFRSKDWGLRQNTGSGKLTITGLEEGEISFS